MAYPRRLLWIIFVVGLCCSYAAATSTDCERPPHVDNASVELVDDESGDFVSVTYTCAAGYRLHGEAELFCDLGTEEWQGEPPACRAETTTTTTTTTTAAPSSGQNRRRKANLRNVEEDTSIDAAFARQLDLSCVGRESGDPVRAPEIDNAAVSKYNRRKNDGNIFLVAYYECDDDFELETPEDDHLYCSKSTWIGSRPRCVGGNANGDYDDGGDDEDGGDDDDDGGDGDDGEAEDNDTDRTNEARIDQTDDSDYKTSEDAEVPLSAVHLNAGETESTAGETTPQTMLNEKHENEIDTAVENDVQTNKDITSEAAQNSDDDNEKPNELVYETNDPIGLETTSTSRPELDIECSSCDHGCRMSYADAQNPSGRNECFCSAGFVLDADDGRTCHAIDKCSVDNGGCEQTCTNNPHGSVECSCEAGLQIDSSDGKSCIDIDECNDARTRQQCTHGCINMPGSYRCAQPPPASANEVYDQDETTEAERDDGGGGSNDGDRNELDTLRRCPDGLRLSATGDECVDIDECAERQHGCDYCRNVFAGFECTCPAGYRLGDDGRTCRDVNECDISADDDGHNVATAAACSHDCHNTIGSYRCGCPDGFDLQADARTCVAARDVCVASDGAEHCSPGRCVATGATFRCECPDGYREKTKRCHDIDECSLNTHNCTHSCENTHGAFRCGCPKGLQLDVEGGHRCVDVDECASVDGGAQLCDDEMECINTHGSYRCMCPEGAHLDAQSGRCVAAASGCALENGGCSHVCEGGTQATCACPHGMSLGEDERTCEIIHPCDVDNGGCSHECNRVDLSCGCPSGWRLIDEVGKQCGDVDECAVDNGGCEQECVNEEGGFRCECETGFVRDSMHTDRCLDIDECAVENGGCSHQCVNKAGAYRCGCPDGYTLDVDSDVLCVEINECELRNGNCSHMCHNVPGSMHCACPAGDSLAADGRTCVPQNECDIGNGGCSHMCTLHDERAVCSCPVGFELQTANTCVDIDECSTQNGGCESGCHNTDGSFECFCNEGYQLRRDGRTCEDIDECIENNGNCSNICLNLVGSHECACETGYRLGADRRQCDDIDECREIQHGCSHECRNVNGSYECGCPEGWRASGHFECEDIDECGEEAGLRCVHGCVNTVGAFNCTCPDGHRLREDGISCEDIDECTDDALHKCSHNCVNRVGSWECTCPAGFRLDSNDLYTCLDVDECADGQALCSHGCENVAGAYRCSCPAGYRLDDKGHTCTDIDECHFNNGGCSHECINEKGSFRCGCPAGHSLQPEGGLRCAADDLCSFANGGCQHECNVVDGGVQCSCPRGLVINRSDNSSCIDVDECGLTPAVCQHVCVNVVGSFQCRCHRGYRLNAQNQCVDVDECAVGNGGCAANSRCINLAGGFKCMCSPGFRLDKRSCVADTCSIFEKPANGIITPSACLTGGILPGERCILHCDSGYKPAERRIAICGPQLRWEQSTNLTCMAVPALAIKPYIRCPPDATLVLRPEQTTMMVRMERPRTNVDWLRNVVSDPAWGKQLGTYLEPGVHTVTFWARSSTSKATDMCRTVITVKEMRAPAVSNCPKNMHVMLSMGETAKKITWLEPSFHSNTPLKEVFKSKLPGESLAAGLHQIKYVAIDQDELRANCEFNITVQSFFHPKQRIHHEGQRVNTGVVHQVLPAGVKHPRRPVKRPQQQQQPQLELGPKETYLLCKDQAQMKLDTSYPNKLQHGCVIKQVNLPSYNRIRRRHSTSNNMMQLYSTWDNQKKFTPQYRRQLD